jgi:hypothetical protein
MEAALVRIVRVERRVAGVVEDVPLFAQRLDDVRHRRSVTFEGVQLDPIFVELDRDLE